MGENKSSGKKVLIWVGVGCGGALLLAIIGVIAVVLVVVHAQEQRKRRFIAIEKTMMLEARCEQSKAQIASLEARGRLALQNIERLKNLKAVLAAARLKAKDSTTIRKLDSQISSANNRIASRSSAYTSLQLDIKKQKAALEKDQAEMQQSRREWER